MSMPLPENMGHLYSVEDVAKQLDVTEETVRRWLRGGDLRGIRLSRKAGWRIRDVDLEVFLNKRTSGGEPVSDPPPED
jgi:excisionase family DNA binding protein